MTVQKTTGLKERIEEKARLGMHFSAVEALELIEIVNHNSSLLVEHINDQKEQIDQLIKLVGQSNENINTLAGVIELTTDKLTTIDLDLDGVYTDLNQIKPVSEYGTVWCRDSNPKKLKKLTDEEITKLRQQMHDNVWMSMCIPSAILEPGTGRP